MKHVLRMACLLVATMALAARQTVQSDYYVINAGLSKLLDAQSPQAVAVSEDGKLMAAIDRSGNLALFQLPAGTAAGQASGLKPGNSAVAISPLDDYVATWTSDQKVDLWSSAGPKAEKSLATAGGKPGTMAFSADGTRLACGGEDGTIRVFNLTSGTQAATGKAHSKAVLALAFEPGGSTIVSVGADRKMTRIDASSGQVLSQKFMPVKVKFDAKPEDEFQQIRSASCTPDGSIFAVGGYNLYRQLGGMPISFEFIVLYDRSGRRLIQIGDKTAVNTSLAVSISPDGKLVGTSAPNGMMRVWDVQHNQLCGQVPGHGSIKMTAVAKTGPNYFFAVAGKSAAVVGVSSVEPETAAPGEQPEADSSGLSIRFTGPTEPEPIVSSPSLEVSAVVSGLKGSPTYAIDLAGRPSAPATLEASDNRDLVLAPAPRDADSASAPVAAKVTPDSVQISQNVTLSEGPNRIKITVENGGRQVTAVKTVCYVPEGDTLDKSKIYSHSFAVVVGINKYIGKGGRNIPELHAAVADAQDVAKALKSEYGFDDVALLTDSEATHDKVLAALNRLTDSKLVHPNDRVVVFWSGHGQTVTAPEGGQIGFLLPSDAQVDFTNLDNIKPYRDTCLPMTELGTLAREIPAKHVLFLVDACFSGLATTNGSLLPTNTFGPLQEAYFDAKQIITASTRYEPAKEKNGHGYFTQALLEAFQDPAADADKDGFLTGTELYKYLLPKVQMLNPNQSPRMAKFSAGIGDMMFFK